MHPDRLEEERKRGITIDLGFAALDLPGFGRAGLVDVPGHERFVRTMVAGAAGVDIVLLVVAMDEGVMPQTLEHLDVCRLLGIQRGVVALTKADLLETLGADFEELVRSDISEALMGTFLKEAPIVTVSATNGSGLPDLLEALSKTARNVTQRDRTGPLFMPIDRAFSMKGFGTVVTGTLLSGSMAQGGEVAIAPGDSTEDTSRVRGLQVHGLEVDQAGAGQRTAVNLAAISRDDIERGSVLVSPGAPVSGLVLDAHLDVLEAFDRPIRQRSRAQIHVGTSHAEATIVLLEGKKASPGSSSFAQIHLDRPLAALPGQPFILRGSRVQTGRGRTIGGGRILGIANRRRRPGRADAWLGMPALASRDPSMLVEEIVRSNGNVCTAEADFPYLTGLPRPPLRRAVELLTSRRILFVADTDRRLFLHEEAIERLERTALDLLEEHHESEPLSPGLSKEALRSSLPGPPPPRVFNGILASLTSKDEVVIEAERVRLSRHAIDIPASETESVERMTKALAGAGLAPPRVDQLAHELDLPLASVRALANRLVEQGELERVKDDLFFHAKAVAKLEQELNDWLDEHGEIDTQSFKSLTGVTRRHAIPLSEYFDQKQVTLRVGERRVRRSKVSGRRAV